MLQWLSKWRQLLKNLFIRQYESRFFQLCVLRAVSFSHIYFLTRLNTNNPRVTKVIGSCSHCLSLVIVKSAWNKPAYFAEKLHLAMKVKLQRNSWNVFYWILFVSFRFSVLLIWSEGQRCWNTFVFLEIIKLFFFWPEVRPAGLQTLVGKKTLICLTLDVTIICKFTLWQITQRIGQILVRSSLKLECIFFGTSANI